MPAWLSDNLGTILVAAVVAAVVTAVVWSMVRRRKRGGGCSCGCDHCLSGGCHTKPKSEQ